MAHGSDSDEFDFDDRPSDDESVRGDEDESFDGSSRGGTESENDASEDEEESDYEEASENFHPNAKKAKHSHGSTAAAGKKKAFNKSANAAKGKKAGGKEKTIEETYQKKTQLEHILLRPDTYIGSVEPLTQPMFVLDGHAEGTPRIAQREITYTPGFYKIFDEIVVNAADNKQRDPGMDRMEVDVDAAKGVVSVTNNGRGIPIARHKEHDCYVATLIFGHLLTGSNFDDDEQKTTGGRNGYGAKLANIFSKKFVVECLDAEQGLKFTQVWRNNMHDAEEPVVEECSKGERKGGDYVKITFRPDFERFNMDGLDEDAAALISKRAYDIAGSMANKEGKKLKVYLNGEKLKVKNFQSYIDLFDGISAPSVFEKISDEWEIGVGSVIDGSGFQQISFVNAIATTKGGGHVDYVTDLLVKQLQAAVGKKNKGGKPVKPAQVKAHLSIFINCLVPNPTFDSQTKENLTTKKVSFKKSVSLSDQFLKKVEKSGIVQSIMQFAKFQESRQLQRKGGTKKNVLKGISKLDDAAFAGTTKSKDCTLIITEGDSAKSLAVSGLSVVGRDYYGVFPLKGKPLNVRDATHAQIMKNAEIMDLVNIMGLKFQQTYNEDNIKTLRYGHLMIMADQDHDGSHIKGLIINFIHHYWPSLLDVPGFLQQFITPIVKCTKGNNTEIFYTLPQFEEWKESTGNDGKGWRIKYYKGLGTSTSAEAKEYFSNLDVHEIHFNELSDDIISRSEPGEEMEVDEEDDGGLPRSGAGLIDMAFSKKKADERKRWISSIDSNTYLNYADAQEKGVNYSDFINKELALFSQADVNRSLPHLLDGLKVSQRKVLYACFKKKLKGEIKVAQLAGYVGEHSAYHHGEMSLHGTIVNLAQNYVGSNNVNLLYPSGQFGTRRMGGKDHASARYIFTRLEKLTRAIYHPDDDDLLNYLSDDGLSIEPDFYVPVIPMLLVNGSEGIGTGWSSSIKSHDPRQVIANIRRMIDKEEPEEMHPYFSGWTGEVIPEKGRREGCYILRGKVRRTNSTTVVISELPVGTATESYKKNVLEKMMAGDDKAGKKKKRKRGEEDDEDEQLIESEITDFKENHTDTTVSFTVTAPKALLDLFEEEKGGLISKFKLQSTISTNNMRAFNKDGKIKTYDTSLDILREFFRQRLVFYIARKNMLLHKMRKDLSMLENKARFVEEVCRGELVVSDRKRSELLADLQERGYDLFPKDDKSVDARDESDDEEEDERMEDSASDAALAKGYEYLLGLKIWSLTFEKAEELRRQKADKSAEVEELDATSPEKIWSRDLDSIEELLDERDAALGIEQHKQTKPRRKKKASVVKKTTKTTKSKNDEWDSEASEAEELSESEDSDPEESEDDFVMAKPAPKAKSAKKNGPKKVERSKLSGFDSDDEAPLKKPVGKKAAAKAPAKKPAKQSAKVDARNKSVCEWDSDAASESESEGSDTEDSESEDDFMMEKPAPKAKAAPKKAATKVDKPVGKSKGVLKEKKQPKATAPKRSTQCKSQTKRKSDGGKGAGESKGLAARSKSAPKARMSSSKGKTSVSLGISPKLSFSKKKQQPSRSKNEHYLPDFSSDDEDAPTKNDKADNFLVDSDDDESPTKKSSKFTEKKRKAAPRERLGRGNATPNYAVNGNSSSEGGSDSEEEF